MLSRYGPAEKLGLDETFVDVTDEVLRRLRTGVYDPPAAPPRPVGHVHSAACAVAADTTYRPQDLRAVQPSTVAAAAVPAQAAGSAAGPQPGSAGQGWAGQGGGGAGDDGGWHAYDSDKEDAWVTCADEGYGPASTRGAGTSGGRTASEVEGAGNVGGEHAGDHGGSGGGGPASWELMLVVGSVVAAEARAAVKAETGIRSSAGGRVVGLVDLWTQGLHGASQGMRSGTAGAGTQT